MPSGTFDIAPNSTVTFWYAVIGSPFGTAGQPPSERDTSDLVLRYKWARYYFGLLLAGIAEQRHSAELPASSAATIVRGVLILPPSLLSPPSSLFSLDGRKVIDLRPGANDVSALSPGLYFVQQKPQAPNSKPQAVRRIVVTR
jgi:hypothetical protein